MSSKPYSGYLVVRTDSYNTVSRNRRYSGVDKIPPYPSSCPEEGAAIEDYALGDYKDFDSNLIQTHARALELWERLRPSRHRYDIIFCCYGAENDGFPVPAENAGREVLGYDVANIGADYWSIVDDFASDDWAQSYFEKMNEHGLFSSRDVAVQYLDEYRRRREADWDAQFEIIFIIDVTPIATEAC